MKEVIEVPGVMPYEPLGFTNCVRSGGILYLSGIGGVDADGKLVADDIVRQTEQTFANISRILEVGGSDLAHILQMTSFVVNLEKNGPGYVRARQRIIATPTFTSATIGVCSLLVPGMLLEVQCRAEVRD